MMHSWVILTFLYSLFKGFCQCSQKKALEKNSIYEVLAYYSLLSFLIVAFTTKNILDIQFNTLILISIKSIVIVIAWLLALYAIKRMPISLYGVINVSRVIFSILLSVIFLGEKLDLITVIGIIIVIIGLVLMNKISNKSEEKSISFKAVIVLLICCLLNATSAIIDKVVLINTTSDILQLWFLLFLTIIYWIILIMKEKKINLKSITTNYWIPIIAISMVVGDRLLFMANEIPESKVSIISVLKQVATLEMIILSKFLFKEKNIIKKLLCSILVIFGIILTLI